jgi:hypothetical protein
MKVNKKICATVLAVAALSAGNSLAAEKWMTGDIHQHTTFTDGSFPMNDLSAPGTIVQAAWGNAAGLYRKGVMPQGFRFGLDFQANSEHGGIRNRDGFSNNWYPTFSPSVIIGDGASPTQTNMWRWQSLIRTSDIPGYSGVAYMGAYDWILGIRAHYPDKLAMTGMEWNPPGHEHSSFGIWDADAKPIAEFEYRFDKSDTDGSTTDTTATTMGWPGKRQNSTYTAPDYSAVLGLNAQHNKTIDAVKWLADNYPTTSYVLPAHVERAGCGVNAWSIASFRDMNDTAPTVAFGFEGIPGHEKSSNRGEFGTGACGGGSYGGAGIYVAQVGGLWDNLLADGRKFYNFASSDFHNDAGSDFWPGEYLKTYTKVKYAGDAPTQEDVLNGLRSGNTFSVHGDIVSDLDFRVFHGSANGNKKAAGHNNATMGETLPVEKGDKVTVQIRFKTPATNNCEAGVNASANYVCKAPSVHHVQLIQGRVNPTKASKLLADGSPNPAFNAIDPTVASIAKTFDATSWTTDAEGYTVMTYVVPNVQNDMFFRIRGSNLDYNVKVVNSSTPPKTIYGTDAVGSPLINTPGTNNADHAWSDLWFYSNPIFVKAL